MRERERVRDGEKEECVVMCVCVTGGTVRSHRTFEDRLTMLA